MNVKELSKDQLTELKEHYYMEKMAEIGEGVSWGELANINEIITNEEIFEAYGNTFFVNDDFSCTCGM